MLGALALSLLLHGGLLGLGRGPAPVPVPAATLEAVLRQPPPPAPELLKNTLEEAPASVPAPSPAPVEAAPKPAPARPAAEAVAAAQRQLAPHIFYPPEALEQGLEGEVRLLLTLAEDGTVLEADLARSSGHPLLDQAALAAARHLGRLPGIGVRELILPVVFRLG